MTWYSNVSEHECDEKGKVDIDICTACGEHSSFCSLCGMNNCCGVGEVNLDYDE